MGSWPNNNWEESGEHLKVAFLNFRQVPGFTAKDRGTRDSPYFKEFMDMFMDSYYPYRTNPLAWL